MSDSDQPQNKSKEPVEGSPPNTHYPDGQPSNADLGPKRDKRAQYDFVRHK